MAVASEKLVPEGKVWSLCKLPFWHSTNSAPSSSSSSFRKQNDNVLAGDHQPSILHSTATSKVPSMSIKSFLPTRRRLSLDPSNKLYFPCKFCTLIYFPIHTFVFLLFVSLICLNSQIPLLPTVDRYTLNPVLCFRVKCPS